MNYLFIYVSFLGISAYLPGLENNRNHWIGLRYFLSVGIIILVLFVGNVLLEVPLVYLTWIIFSFAVGGIGYTIFWDRNNLRGLCFEYVQHPIFLFPLLCILTFVFFGEFEYLPFPGDETASWLRYARQIYLIDAYWSKDIVYHLGGYTPGWPLFVAFSNFFGREYSDNNGIVLVFLMHIGLLGFLYDFLMFLLRKNQICSDSKQICLSWLLLLGLLTIEVSWILFPTVQLVEKPLLYLIIGTLLLGLLGQIEQSRLRIALYMGLVVSSGYLIKMSMLALVPSLGLFLLSYLILDFNSQQRENFLKYLKSSPGIKRLVTYLGFLFVPLIFVYFAWTFNKFGDICLSSPKSYMQKFSGLISSESFDLAEVVGVAMVDYLVDYKVELTAVSIVVLLVCTFRPGLRWFICSVSVFIVVWLFLLHSTYYICLNEYIQYVGLQSLQRYMRPILRVVHFFAPILLLLFLFDFSFLKNKFRSMVKASKINHVIIVLLFVLTIWQGWAVFQSFSEVTSRHSSLGTGTAQVLQNIRTDTKHLVSELSNRKLKNPKISIITQGGYGMEFNLASYLGIKKRRDGFLFHFTPTRPYKWNLVKQNTVNSNEQSAKENLRTWLLTFPVIWPIILDELMKGALSPLILSQECRANPERYFLFNAGTGTFDCVLRKSVISK